MILSQDNIKRDSSCKIQCDKDPLITFVNDQIFSFATLTITNDIFSKSNLKMTKGWIPTPSPKKIQKHEGSCFEAKNILSNRVKSRYKNTNWQKNITQSDGQATIILHDSRCWTSPKVKRHKQRALPLFSTWSQTSQLVTLTQIYSAIKHSTRGLCYAKIPPEKCLSKKLLLSFVPWQVTWKYSGTHQAVYHT